MLTAIQRQPIEEGTGDVTIVRIHAEHTRRQAKVMALLDRSGGPLRGLLFRLTTSEQATSELVQDLFLRLYESDAFARAEDGFSYAWRTAVNLALDWRRRQRRVLPLERGTPPTSTSPSPLDAAVKDEDTQRVLDAVARLEEPGRSVVILHFLEQQSYEQIAGRLGRKTHHLRSICSKAVGQLRQDLAVTDKGGLS